MSVKAFADESGTHGSSNVVIIAGWVSTRKKLGRFCKQWQHQLNERHAPYLHMRELDPEERKRDRCKFRKWNNKRVDKFVRAMIPIVRDNAVFGLICAVDITGYKSLHPDFRAPGADYSSSYVFAFQLYFEELLKVLNGKSKFNHGIAMDEVCHPVFAQGPHEEAAHRAFKILKDCKDANDRYGNVVFANPKDTELKNGTMVKATLPLQAADLLAHKAFRIYQSETSGKEIERGTPEWELKAKGNLLVSHITEQDSLDFMARIEKKHRKGNCAN